MSSISVHDTRQIIVEDVEPLVAEDGVPFAVRRFIFHTDRGERVELTAFARRPGALDLQHEEPMCARGMTALTPLEIARGG